MTGRHKPDSDALEPAEMWLPGLMLALLMTAVALPVLLIQLSRPLGPVDSMQDFDGLRVPSEWADQALFHRPIIDTMHQQWPSVDIVEYDSATAPGYHALMAVVQRTTSGEFDPDHQATFWPLLALNFAFGLGLVLVVYGIAAKLAGPWPALWLCLPLAASKYILAGTGFLTTDNLAWIFVAMALGLASFSRARPLALLGAGVFAMMAVGVRQIMIWSAGPAVLAGLLSSPLAKFGPAWLIDHPLRPRWRPLIFAMIGAVFAFALLGMFIALWGGLVPQASEFVRIHATGPNLATPAFLFALFGACGVFFLPLVWRECRELLEKRLIDGAALLAMAIGAFVAVAVPTAATTDQPRDTQLWKARAYGWLWEMARRGPDVAERSIVIIMASTAGALGLLLLWRAARRSGRGNEATILLVGVVGFTAAQTLNTMAWQRYFEPIVLIALAWLGALVWPSVWREAQPVQRRLMVLSPAVLTLLLLSLSVFLLLLPMARYAAGQG